MKRFKFFVPGRLPGMNEIIAASKVRSAKYSAYAEMKKEVEGRIQLAAATCPKFDHPDIELIWIEPNRRRDPNNVRAGQKFIFDALKDAGKIPGDGWKHSGWYSDSFETSKGNPGVVVVLTEGKR